MTESLCHEPSVSVSPAVAGQCVVTVRSSVSVSPAVAGQCVVMARSAVVTTV